MTSQHPQGGTAMTILAWILLGLIAGLVTTAIVNHGAMALDIALGVAGSIVGGLIFNGIADGEITRFDLQGLLVAVAGAALVLAIYHSISRRRLA
jgi:uncharacterized membrane protein YeaQ/YmgE (transglycosylase-associated protein family)